MCEKKCHYVSAMDVGNNLYRLVLRKQHDSDETFDISEIDQLDLTGLDDKLCKYLNKQANKAIDLQKEFKKLKKLRNDIQHKTQKDLKKFTDTYILQKINELRDLFMKILVRINFLYNEIIIDYEKLKLDDELDQVMNKIIYEVTDNEVGPFLNTLHGRQCPSKVKIEIKESPQICSELMPLLERLSTEDVDVWLLINKAYYEDADQHIYDSEKFLTPLLESNTSKLTWYRGNLTTDMITKLPATLTQLNIRMRKDQIKHFHDQLPNLTELMRLGLYLDLTKKDSCYEVDTIDPSSLPEFDYKSKQLGLRICACITTGNIPWVVEVIKKIKMNHQCDTLEFYQTRLNKGEDIERLLRALKDSDIHVTRWVKLQNEIHDKGDAEQVGLNNLAKMDLSLSGFMFMRHWQQDQSYQMTPSASNASLNTTMDSSFDTSMDTN